MCIFRCVFFFIISRGVHGLGLCPTRDQPTDPPPTGEGVGSARSVLHWKHGRLVKTVHSERSSQNSWFQAKKHQIWQRSNRIWWDLARSDEILLDLDEISLDLLDKSPKYENLLLESEILMPKSGNLRPESGKSRRILEIFVEIWKFFVGNS